MLPHGCPGRHKASRGVPLNVSHAVVVSYVHQLQVCSHIFLRLGLLALEVEIEEVQIGTLLVVNGGNDHKTASGRPVDGIAVLLVKCAEMLEVAGVGSLGLLWAKEGHGCLGGHCGGSNRLCGADDGETVTLGLPCKVDDCILDSVNNLYGDTLLLDAENLESSGLGLLGLGVTVDLDTEIRGIRLPVELSVANAEQVETSHNLL